MGCVERRNLFLSALLFTFISILKTAVGSTTPPPPLKKGGEGGGNVKMKKEKCNQKDCTLD